MANLNGANVISSFDYSYNEIGNRTALDQVRSGVTINSHLDYSYDNLDRLVSATHTLPSTPDEVFSYDPVGNRISTLGQTTNSIFNENNQLLEDQNFTYQYDLNGNLTQKTDKNTSEVTTFTYDAENRLIQVDKDGVISTYKYDGLGRRIEKNLNGEIIKFIYEDFESSANANLLFDQNNNLIINYFFDNVVDRVLIIEKDSESYFVTTDVLGSVVELIDSTTLVQESNVYKSFGSLIQVSGNVDVSLKYTGREIEADLGIYYYRNRYYDSDNGRFLSEDPIGLQGGINFYSYVSNNPLKFIDPLGLIGCDNQCLADCFTNANRKNSRCKKLANSAARGSVAGRGIRQCPKLQERRAVLICTGLFATVTETIAGLSRRACDDQAGRDRDDCFDQCCGDNQCLIDDEPTESRCCSLGRGI